ncbi:MAG: hypothetical protein LBI28_07120 [Treponema sp.]|jgi:hypothetical protein|nr:hypothetical protein [Treponema sp.]
MKLNESLNCTMSELIVISVLVMAFLFGFAILVMAIVLDLAPHSLPNLGGIH